MGDPDGPSSASTGSAARSTAIRRLTSWNSEPAGTQTATTTWPVTDFATVAVSAFRLLSPLRLATAGMPDAYVRQLCWRDFYHQLLAGIPEHADHELPARHAAIAGSDDRRGLARWKQGETGVDIVDAGDAASFSTRG